MAENKNDWVLERSEIEMAILDEAKYLKEVSRSLKVVGLNKLAEELHLSAINLEYCAKRNGEITSLELDERINASSEAMGEILSAALNTKGEEDETIEFSKELKR